MRKRKIILNSFSTVTLSIVLAVAFFTFINTPSSQDKLLMENIEALANIGETDKNPINLKNCYMSVTPDPGSGVATRKCDSETTATTIYACSTEWIEGHYAQDLKKCYE